MKNKSHLTAFLFILTIIIFAASCGGGGGGGGSVVSFGNNSKPHNGGDAGGWGNGGYTGNGFGGNGGGLGSSGDSNIVITGSTPLEVGTYNYNGASYDSVEALYAALAASSLEDVFYVDFQVEGESTPRKARVTANGKSNDGNDILIEHQYKAFFPDENGGTQEVLFYKRDGIELPGASGSVNIDGFEFEKGWQIDGSFAPAGSKIGVASGGDVNLQDRAVLKTAVYGYKADTGASGGYILGFNPNELTADDTVTVTTDRKITKLQLPSTSINLDLSGATNFKTVNLTNDNPGNLKSITLPSNAETIAGTAFSGCTNLTSVTLPSTLTSIEYDAFSGCEHLQSIEIPAGVTSIAGNTFYGCTNLSSITLPPNLTSIGNFAFSGCTSLTEFVIPNGVKILHGTFYGCSNLKKITIPNSVETIEELTFSGVKENCELIFNTSKNRISKSGTNPFPQDNYKVKFTGTTIPTYDATTSLFNADSHLKEVTIENTITSIPASAFKNCTGLNNGNITIPASVTYIGTGAFDDIGNGLTLTFAGTGNQTLTAFDCPNNQHKVVLGHGVPTNSSNASIFQNDTNLTELTFQGGQFGVNNTFSGCTALQKVTFNSYPSDVSSRSNILPSSVHNIVFKSGLQAIANVKDVGNLFPSTMNYSSLTVTFDNSSGSIRITPNPMNPNPTAFDFDGAENITYKFAVNPNTNMIYDNGTCFKDGQTATAGGTTYTWDSSTKSWQP